SATIFMVDSNLQRESLRPSERAFAFRMKLEAIKHQGERSDLTSRQVGEKSQTSIQLVASQAGESQRQVQRYIRLTELIPELLDMVDRSEEHTPELQSRFDLVCRLLLEKKKQTAQLAKTGAAMA